MVGPRRIIKDFDVIEINALALNVSLGALKLQQPRWLELDTKQHSNSVSLSEQHRDGGFV